MDVSSIIPYRIRICESPTTEGGVVQSGRHDTFVLLLSVAVALEEKRREYFGRAFCCLLGLNVVLVF